MRNSDENDQANWIIKLAQRIREEDSGSALETSASNIRRYDPLTGPAVLLLAEFVDRCGFDITLAYLEGYAYELLLAGTIDDRVLRTVIAHARLMDGSDPDEPTFDQFAH